MEEFRLGFSRFAPFIPGINVYNSCKIGVSGSDVFGYCKNGQEIQEAKTIPQTLVQEGKTAVIGKMRDLNKAGSVDINEFKIAGFLGAERNLLQSKGWIYSSGFWYAP